MALGNEDHAEHEVEVTDDELAAATCMRESPDDDSELHSSEFDECYRDTTWAWLNGLNEPDEEECPRQSSSSAAWLNAGVPVAASAGFQASAAAVRTAARLAVVEAITDLSLQDALLVLEQVRNEVLDRNK
eukprot:11593150-Heterocapsa_arctica.AAC.1